MVNVVRYIYHKPIEFSHFSATERSPRTGKTVADVACTSLIKDSAKALGHRKETADKTPAAIGVKRNWDGYGIH
jgi:hypothetical protein